MVIGQGTFVEGAMVIGESAITIDREVYIN